MAFGEIRQIDSTVLPTRVANHSAGFDAHSRSKPYNNSDYPPGCDPKIIGKGFRWETLRRLEFRLIKSKLFLSVFSYYLGLDIGIRGIKGFSVGVPRL